MFSKVSMQLLSIPFASNNSLNCFIVEYSYRIAFIIFSKLLSEYVFSSISDEVHRTKLSVGSNLKKDDKGIETAYGFAQ